MTTQNDATAKVLTYGEKAVGLTFNPSSMPEVDEIKRACAAAIDALNTLRESGKYSGEALAQFTLGIRKLQEGQMWGVKAATWQY